MSLNSNRFRALHAILFFSALIVSGCASPHNHITVVEVPSGDVAGVSTERGILVLKKPVIKLGDIYDIQHVYGNGIVEDNARVVDMDEYLALLAPVSSQLNNCRFLMYPIEPDEELHVGILDKDNEARYLAAMLYERGNLGDLVTCPELHEYPEPSPEGYGGIGLFAYRDGSQWLVGVLTSMKAEIPGANTEVYPFVGLDKIWDFMPDLKDRFTHEKKPFRPDFIYGVERDGTGE
ncbi:MAG: hypothetical protein ACYTG7_00500 [Planctomycetota bacterium]